MLVEGDRYPQSAWIGQAPIKLSVAGDPQDLVLSSLPGHCRRLRCD
jgi:hypothetical protein